MDDLQAAHDQLQLAIPSQSSAAQPIPFDSKCYQTGSDNTSPKPRAQLWRDVEV